jgi:hypothetical protein
MDACGKLMARYGATPLLPNTWYHVAGVYDAASKTLDVYLNGQLDNGFLLGSVSSIQQSSREAVYVGRRPNSLKFHFSGLIHDVRIYSFALTKSQIAADMRGELVDAAMNPAKFIKKLPKRKDQRWRSYRPASMTSLRLLYRAKLEARK